MFDIAGFGAYVRELRKLRGMTQESFAMRINVTRQAVSKYERGESFPDITVLCKIGETLGVNVDELLNTGSTGVYSLKKTDALRIIELADCVNDRNVCEILRRVRDREIDSRALAKIIPVIGTKRLNNIFGSILKGRIDSDLITVMLPYMEYGFYSLVEAAVIEGALDFGILKKLRA